MLLRLGLEKGLKAVLEYLKKGTTPLVEKDAITVIARGMCQGDLELADMLSEIFDFAGPEGMIIVEGAQKMGLEREYIEGTYWDLSGWLSRLFQTDPVERRTLFEDAALLISDLDIKDPLALVPVLETCVKNNVKKLVIIVKDLSDAAIGLLINNNRAKTIETLAVRTPKVTEMDRVASMQDIAALTGGRIFYSAAGDNFDAFKMENLGYARRAWATESLFGIYGGKGDPRKVRQHMVELRGMLKKMEDDFNREGLQKRLGRMQGGTAILRAGALIDTEREVRKGVATRAVAGLRNALLSGVVPGGGTAFLNAQAVVWDLIPSSEDEEIAFKILARALEEPMRVIAGNAGYMPDVIIEKLKSSPEGHGLDARSGQIVDMREAGILDSTAVLEKALAIAVSGAGMALTTDVIIHHKEPKETLEP